MIYPKTIEVIEKIPELGTEEYVYSLKDLGKTKRVIGKYTSIEEVERNKAFKEYIEVIFTTKKPGAYNEYRCLFSSKENAKKAFDEVYKLWKSNQARLASKNLRSSSFVVI